MQHKLAQQTYQIFFLIPIMRSLQIWSTTWIKFWLTECQALLLMLVTLLINHAGHMPWLYKQLGPMPGKGWQDSEKCVSARFMKWGRGLIKKMGKWQRAWLGLGLEGHSWTFSNLNMCIMKINKQHIWSPKLLAQHYRNSKDHTIKMIAAFLAFLN